MTNGEVVELVKARLSGDVIVAKIRSTTEVNFDTSAAGLAALKAADVPDTVIVAMLQPSIPTARNVQKLDCLRF